MIYNGRMGGKASFYFLQAFPPQKRVVLQSKRGERRFKMGNKTNVKTWLVTLVFLVATACGIAAGEVIYVDDDASFGGNGQTWGTAYKYLQDALLADAISGDQVWVAAGVYKPDQDEGGNVTPGDRTATFQLINGVLIKGSYAGSGQPDPNARDIVLYESILSGDLNGNDVPVSDPCDLLTEPTRAENSYHVVTGDDTDETAILDGFTITAGNANESSYPHQFGGGLMNEPNSSPTLTNCTFSGNSADIGGGMLNDSNSNPTLINCTLSGNSASGSGGGMYNFQSSPTLTNCTFSGNKAKYGGGLLNYAGSTNLVNCTFSGNSADFGGGMFNWHNGSATLTNCTFSGNSADYGGGMYNWDNSRPTLSNCTFTMNATYMGGGMYNSESSPTLTNCTFSGNEANYGYGGGMYNGSSSPTVTDCTFSGNSTDRGGGMANFDSSSPVVTNCTFSDNTAEFNVGGGGMCNCSSSPTVINCTFSSNLAVRGGGMSNWPASSPTVTNCKFYGNTAGDGGGGMYNRDSSSPTVTNCTFSGNSTLEDGGGMHNMISSSPTLTNCTFSGNEAGTAPGYSGYGGGMYNWSSSSPTVTNCTFSQNSAGAWEGGSGMYNLSSCSPTVTNCIFWSNLPSEIRNNNAYASLTYCDVLGGYAGEGNIDTDPLFMDADGPDDTVGTADDNLRLLAGSPCIDAADNTAVPSGVTTDLDGKPRFVDDLCTTDTGNPPDADAIVDMGAYEFLRSDIDSNGAVDLVDFSRFALYWKESGCGACGGADLTCDGDVDLYDLKEFGDNWLAGVAN